ncbi:MAG: hypothetical protein J0I23_01940 [Rhizobiales bacterium]|nr:hypothetical protein [Hyphomicrobiales bacterium]
MFGDVAVDAQRHSAQTGRLRLQAEDDADGMLRIACEYIAGQAISDRGRLLRRVYAFDGKTLEKPPVHKEDTVIAGRLKGDLQVFRRIPAGQEREIDRSGGGLRDCARQIAAPPERAEEAGDEHKGKQNPGDALRCPDLFLKRSMIVNPLGQSDRFCRHSPRSRESLRRNSSGDSATKSGVNRPLEIRDGLIIA